VISVLGDTRKRRSLEQAAAALAAKYDWSVIATQFEAVLHRASNVASRDGVQPEHALEAAAPAGRDSDVDSREHEWRAAGVGR
jgi:hypothetical protein